MGIHHISWQSTASGLEDEYIHAAALSWLVGDEEAVEIERMNSYHGSPIHIVTAEIKRRGQATKSLSRLGEEALNLLKSQLDERIDDDNDHVRIISTALTLCFCCCSSEKIFLHYYRCHA